jgi:inward rectifier potassium channel
MKRKRAKTSQQRSQKSIRIVKQENGKFHIDGMGAWYSYWRDPYHLMLTIPWWGFIGVIAIAYIALNAFFALLYLAGGDSLTGARPGSFEDAFFFSVHTLASIGYGVIAPKTTYANIIVTIEAITSLLTIAVVTGLAFARFAKPLARVVFSRYVVITPHEGVPTLMFRMANKRRNQIVEAQLKAYLLRDEMTKEGDFFYRVYDLPLLRDRTPAFTLSWTVMHSIDENSPLYGMTTEELTHSHAQIAIVASGLDESVAYSMTFRHNYGHQEILFNYRFVDIICKSSNGDRYFDYSHFHQAVPLDEITEPPNRDRGLGWG